MTAGEATLTGALEDYLETIFELVQEHDFARVKDIARSRKVRSGSVTPAMRRLAKLGLIQYIQREYIKLTPQGEQEARRVYAKHRILTRFFKEILQMPDEVAQTNACSMEHSLSAEGMSQLVRFFEFLQLCPEGGRFIERFQQCPQLNGEATTCQSCTIEQRPGEAEPTMSIAQLNPGDRGRISQVSGSGAIRQRILDMGILPDELIEVERVAPAGDPIWIKIRGSQLALRRKEAQAVMVLKE